MTSIIAKNITGSNVPLVTLGVSGHEVVASGQVDLTLGNTVHEIQNSAELKAHISSGNLIIQIDGIDLNKRASLNACSTVVMSNRTMTAGPIEKRFLLGDVVNYPLSAKISKNLIQYTRVWLHKGEVLENFETFIETVQSGKKLKFALYDQENQINDGGEPRTKLFEDEVVLTSNDEGYKTVAISSYQTPYSGFFWIAIATNSSKIKLATSATFNTGFIPARWEKASSFTMPNTSGGVKAKSAIVYSALLLET